MRGRLAHMEKRLPFTVTAAQNTVVLHACRDLQGLRAWLVTPQYSPDQEIRELFQNTLSIQKLGEVN